MNVTWDYPAERTWKELDLGDAYVVARAVYRLAETGEGELRKAPPYYRLRAGRFDLELTMDPEADTLCVLHIYRAKRIA